jgi:hypothetical protein
MYERRFMVKEAVFTIKLEPELRAAFMAKAALEDRPASQIMRELMRGYIAAHGHGREYEDYLHRKVERARISMRGNVGLSNDELEQKLEAFRALTREVRASNNKEPLPPEFDNLLAQRVNFSQQLDL